MTVKRPRPTNRMIILADRDMSIPPS
jgi:hypothetical protein